MPPALSIVIPAWAEEAALPRTLGALPRAEGIEILVVDGGSPDGTAEAARRAGARVLGAPRGRGAQLDAGARAAAGEHLLFLHADSTPPSGFPERIAETLGDRSVVLGAFTLAFDARGARFRALERATALRNALTRTPYGDQGLFVRRADYLRLGGFPHWSLLEDVALVRRWRRHGRVVILPERIVTSARRYRSRGFLRPVLRNRLAATLWTLRVPPETIWRLAAVQEGGRLPAGGGAGAVRVRGSSLPPTAR